MNSKLDYLKKYGLPGGDVDGAKKKRRKKKAPGTKDGQDTARSVGGLRIIDDDADMPTLDTRRVNKAWEEEETEEEKPMLVLEDTEGGKKTQSGSWTTIRATGSDTRIATKIGEDASPPRRKRARHDSSDEDGDASPPRRNGRSGGGRGGRIKDGEDASPPLRSTRHGGLDEDGDASPPRRNGPGGGGRGGRGGDEGDASPPRRRRMRRHDSSDEERDAIPPRQNGGSNDQGAADASPQRCRRADASPPRRARADGGNGDRRGERGDDGRGGARRRATVSPSVNRKGGDGGGGRDRSGAGSSPGRSNGDRHDASPPQRRRARHDSDADDYVGDPLPPSRAKVAAAAAVRGGEDGSDASPPRRRGRPDYSSRGDGERDDGGKRRSRHASPDKEKAVGGGRGGDAGSGHGGGEGSDRVKTSSGYYAGLQSGKDFKIVEQNLKRKHDAEMKAADKSSSGQGAQTVYRDKKGRKLDMLNEFMKSQDARAGKEVEEAKEQFAWGRGKVQKEEEKQWKEELENIAAEPFARTVDDARLEEARKAEIRADDPMAAYMAKKKAKERVRIGKPVKPEYKGPPPKPNRFGIRPGYRWDGNDRGNGWEDRIVAKGVDNNYKAELAYKWATADM